MPLKPGEVVQAWWSLFNGSSRASALSLEQCYVLVEFIVPQFQLCLNYRWLNGN